MIKIFNSTILNKYALNTSVVESIIETISIDTDRKVIKPENILVDTVREIKEPGTTTLLLDTARKVIKLENILIDTNRKPGITKTVVVDTNRIVPSTANNAVKKYPLQADLLYNAENDGIKIFQNDFSSVVFSIAITSNDKAVDLTNNNVSITIKRPDKKVNISNCTIKDAKSGIVEYVLTERDTCIPGMAEFTLELYYGRNKGRVTTQKCKYTVIHELGGDNAVIADDRYPILDELIKQVQDILQQIQSLQK